MYFYYLKRTLVVANVEKLPGKFFLQNTEDFQAHTTHNSDSPHYFTVTVL